MINCSVMRRPLTFEDLQEQYAVERGFTKGEGRYKVKGQISYVKTRVGEIERQRWQQMVRELIRASGEEDLFDALQAWVGEYTPWLHTDLERRNYALGLHADRVFDNEAWVGFVSFNKKYRPERLLAAGLVTVVPDCCGKEGIVTRSQIQNSGGTICCPYCGRFSSFAEK